MNMRFTPEVVAILSSGGWFEGRRVDLPEYARLAFPKARAVLEEFYGLTVGNAQPGIHIARVKVQFEPHVSFAKACVGEAERKLKTRLYCIGEMDGGHGTLFIEENGAIDFLEMVSCDWYRLGPTIEIALEHLLLGLKTSEEPLI